MILETDSESSSSSNSISSRSVKKGRKTMAVALPKKETKETTTDWTQTEITMFNILEKLLPEFNEQREYQAMINSGSVAKPEENVTVHQFAYISSQKYEIKIKGDAEILGKGKLVKGSVMKNSAKNMNNDGTLSGQGSVANMGLMIGSPMGKVPLEKKHTSRF